MSSRGIDHYLRFQRTVDIRYCECAERDSLLESHPPSFMADAVRFTVGKNYIVLGEKEFIPSVSVKINRYQVCRDVDGQHKWDSYWP